MTIFRSLSDVHELVDSFTRPVRTMLPVSRLRDDPGGEQIRWQAIVELGWLGISVPEDAGGIGLSALEEVLAAQSFGRQLISTNYPATVIAAHAFHKAGDNDIVGALLAGEARAAFALHGSAPAAGPEVCDGDDNDCDGEVDDGCEEDGGNTGGSMVAGCACSSNGLADLGLFAPLFAVVWFVRRRRR